MVGKTTLVYHVLENKLRHGAAADIAVADEKYFYHGFLLVFYSLALKMQIVVNQSRIKQVVSSKNSGKTERLTTKDF